MIDKRDPEQLGNMIIQLKEIYPDKAAPERADLIEQYFGLQLNLQSILNFNGK